ncbi:hypothetical protein FQN55_005781 [Onygenales sp. PD_40]|nr:hypothetical protein FQN55_005781 [Onygenales sp. PD_40]KAK2802847.1 hypothetical protein FQN51_004109 [Onygenales sp. PD_10]
MGRPHFRLPTLSWAFYFIFPIAIAGGIQYCRQQPPLCFSVAHHKNQELGGHDIHITLTATPSSTGGWVAVGIGGTMAGALMFIMYSDQSRKSLVTSIQTTRGHLMPTVLTGGGMNVAAYNSSISATGYHAEFACYSCEQWWSAPISTTGMASFIYAANDEQTFATAEIDSALDFHTAWGIVQGDMDQAFLGDRHVPISQIQSGQTKGFVQVSENRHVTEYQASPSPARSSHWPTPGDIHGVVMTLVFMGLFLPGGIIIQLPLPRAFMYHWTIQLFALLLAFSSAAYMVVQSTHFDLHKILGLMVVILLVVQAVVGYKHHVAFVKIRQRSVFTTVHRWLGRGLLFLGTLNVAFGLRHKGRPNGAIYAWFVVWLVEIVVYIWVTCRKQRRERRDRGELVPKDEHSNDGMFSLGEDDSDLSDDSDDVV